MPFEKNLGPNTAKQAPELDEALGALDSDQDNAEGATLSSRAAFRQHQEMWALMRQFWKTAKSGEVDEEVSTSFREKAGRFILEILKKPESQNLSKERLDNKLEKFIKKVEEISANATTPTRAATTGPTLILTEEEAEEEAPKKSTFDTKYANAWSEIKKSGGLIVKYDTPVGAAFDKENLTKLLSSTLKEKPKSDVVAGVTPDAAEVKEPVKFKDLTNQVTYPDDNPNPKKIQFKTPDQTNSGEKKDHISATVLTLQGVAISNKTQGKNCEVTVNDFEDENLIKILHKFNKALFRAHASDNPALQDLLSVKINYKENGDPLSAKVKELVDAHNAIHASLKKNGKMDKDLKKAFQDKLASIEQGSKPVVSREKIFNMGSKISPVEPAPAGETTSAASPAAFKVVGSKPPTGK